MQNYRGKNYWNCGENMSIHGTNYLENWSVKGNFLNGIHKIGIV